MSISCQVKPQEHPIQLGIATTLRERTAVYRFRYSVYVEELAMQFSHIDHRNKLLYDKLDEWAILLYARSGPKIVATMRINIGPLASFPQELAAMFSLGRFQEFRSRDGRQNFAYTSKLMVSPFYRNSTALHLLTAKGYELGYDKVQFNFGVCNFHLLRLYEQFGWRRLGGSFAGPDYDGVIAPIVFLADDIEHLRAVRSPFYRLARKRDHLDKRAADWFNREFPESASFINSQLISEDQLWAIIGERLGRSPVAAIPLLQGLSPAEGRKLLHACGVITKFRAGEPIIARGYLSHTLNILLSGKLNARLTAGSVPAAVLPGQVFAEAGLAAQPGYTQDFTAATAAEVLVLSGLNFQRFQFSHPAIADKILTNLSAGGRHYEHPEASVAQ